MRRIERLGRSRVGGLGDLGVERHGLDRIGHLGHDGRRRRPGRADHRCANAAPVSIPTTCPTWSAANVTGKGSAPLDEVSGLAVGRRNPDLLWTHNDSGDCAADLRYRTSRRRVVTEVSVAGAGALDWEDIAIGPGPAGDDRPWIWVPIPATTSTSGRSAPSTGSPSPTSARRRRRS